MILRVFYAQLCVVRKIATEALKIIAYSRTCRWRRAPCALLLCTAARNKHFCNRIYKKQMHKKNRPGWTGAAVNNLLLKKNN